MGIGGGVALPRRARGEGATGGEDDGGSEDQW